VADDKIRLGGMALPNGVLVHGPTSWACAVRQPDGRLEVLADRKRFRAAEVETPFLRGPARVAELFALLPEVRRRVPGLRLPFERPSILAGMAASAVVVRLLRGTDKITPAAQELLAGLISLAPAAITLRRSDLAAYHGAEHVSIGTYEHGEVREKEHERCGGHLVGPLLLTNAAAGVLANRAPERYQGPARLAAAVGSLAASTEIFAWMQRHPDSKVAQALSKPGHELQHRLSTAEPSPAQLEVADAALQACLALEHGHGDTGTD
jgi:uncharacterized protein YqhQ